MQKLWSQFLKKKMDKDHALRKAVKEIKQRFEDKKKIQGEGIEPKVTWKMIDRGKSFSPVTGVCHLCVKEAFYILFRPELAKLNSKSEVFSACFHKKAALLIKVKRGRKPHGS